MSSATADAHAGRKGGVRDRGRWCWTARTAALSAALLLAACGGDDAPGASRALPEARLIDGGAERSITLPDAWERSAPARQGSVRYRFELPDTAVFAGQAALYLPRVGNAYRIELNAQTLLAAGMEPRAPGDPPPDLSREPVLLPLPGALLLPSGNRLVIEVAGEARREAGLAVPWVGPLKELAPRYEARLNQQVRSAWIVSAAATVMGGLALLLAARARRGLYAWFGAASLLAAWRVSGPQFGDGGAWSGVGIVLFQASYAWFVAMMTLYALAVLGQDTPRLRRAMAGWAAGALALSVAGWLGWRPELRTLMLAGTLALVVWLTVRLLRTVWRERTLAAGLLAAVAIISMALGARDFWVLRVLQDYGALPWARFSIPLLLVVLAWLLADDFARSSAALRGLNRELQDRVAQRERELQAAFEGRREHEREQAVLTERDRILREMHDGLGGRLVAALALTSQVARQSAAPPGGAPRAVDEPLRDLKLTLDDCLVELRLALDSVETEQRPLIEALAELRFRVEPSLRAAGVRLVWQVADSASAVELPPADTLHVLRIVREALTNVIKHAQATVVWLRLDREADGTLVLAVADNGVRQRADGAGDAAAPSGGRGLANMRRRAEAMAARIDSGPHPEGWVVSLWLPTRDGGAVPAMP